MQQNLVFDLDLIKKYDKSGPRYTSYPTAIQFDEKIGAEAYMAAARESNKSGRPLSLYFHIPFCDTVCFYCACNKIATKDRTKAAPYLERVFREIEMQSQLFDSSRVVNQLHWGGGTPTFISHDEIAALMAKTREHFNLASDEEGEFSIELDPREVTDETLALLRKVGFNRVSLGVQDFDPVVQKAVNRIQSEDVTLKAIAGVRAQGFKSLSVDLIYGLPLQTAESFRQTVAKIIAAGPDRVSVFNYAHMPTLFKPQRRIHEEELPKADEKLQILQNTINQLTEAGYVYIGMDHFAKPDDELAIAQREGKLHRNFQGYSTHADADLIAMGVTSISKVNGLYAQNLKTLDEYYDRLDNGQLAVYRGVAMTDEDKLRGAVINSLICEFELNKREIEEAFSIVFDEHFADALDGLAPMLADGLVELEGSIIRVTDRGRLMIRNICMLFDEYLQQPQPLTRFSKVI